MSDDEMLKLLQKPVTRSRLITLTGESDREVRKRIQRLREMGYNIINNR